MRRIAIFLPVLCCLALVGQQFATADEAKEPKDATKDKSKEWKEGSVWGRITEGQAPKRWRTNGPCDPRNY